MKLSQANVAQFVNGKLVNQTDGMITSVTTDTREIKEGALFVALRGEKFDGHDFAVDAVKKGAVAVLSEREDFSEEIPLIVVEDTYKALLMLARGYRQTLDLSVVGVTGSVGKTTTKDLIASVVGTAVKTLKTQGNYNNHIGVPRTVFSIEEDHRAAVIEMGMNHAGEISTLTEVARPDIAVITCIGVSHIGFLGSRENIMKAKLEILEGMRPDAPVVLNVDDDLLGKIESLGEHRIITCSALGVDAYVTAEDICEEELGSSFKIYVGGQFLTEAYLPSIGLHNVQNALLAAAVGVTMGLSGQQIKEGLAAYCPSGMRQRINKIGGVTFVEDCYNASPTSMTASLEVLSKLKGNRSIAVLGDMLELGDISESAHIEVGRFASKKCDLVICQGELAKILKDEAEKGGVKTLWFETREEVSQYLISELKEGDCVLFKASLGMGFAKILEAVETALQK